MFLLGEKLHLFFVAHLASDHKQRRNEKLDAGRHPFCHFVLSLVAKGFSRAEQGLGLGSFKLNAHMVFLFEAELMSREASWPRRRALLNWEPGNWCLVPAV